MRCLRVVPRLKKAKKGHVKEVSFRVGPVNELAVDQRVFAEQPAGKRGHHMKINCRNGQVCKRHLIFDAVIHVVLGERIGVLLHELPGVGACLLFGDMAGKSLLGDVFGARSN